MPYPSEHAARQVDPGGMLRCRRQNDKMGKGIHAIFCVRRADNKMVLQSIRFDKKKFTPDEAKAWLKEHDFKVEGFEAAKK